MVNKNILKMPYVPLVLAITALWFGGSTYWYVCQTQELCNDESNQTATAEDVGTDIVVDPVVVEPPEEVTVSDVPQDESAATSDEGEPAAEAVTPPEDESQEPQVASATDFDTMQTVTAFYAPNQAAFARTGWENTLTSFAHYLEDNPGQKVEIAGYAANVSNEVDEDSLSRSRAQALADFLIAAGANSDQIDIVAKAYEEPIGDNATEAGRAKNRRAVVRFK